ncbi:MAG: class I SAM-dependent methyltransferase [Nocardioides sp.]
MSDQLPPVEAVAAYSFGPSAGAHHRGRPAYPAVAVEWLTGSSRHVLELGAGAGRLTEQLVALDHEVYATDPDEQILAILRGHLPDVRTAVATAEEIPLPDGCIDVVVCAQSFHRFDLDRTLPEIHRVLASEGRISVLWNERDERIPWVRRLGRLLGSGEPLRDLGEPLLASGLFHAVEKESFNNWHQVDRETLQDLALSTSATATLDDAERARKRIEVGAFYDEFERGIDGLRLPYVTRCFRATALALDHGEASSPASTGADTRAGADDPAPAALTNDRSPLIDFGSPGSSGLAETD